MSFMRKIKMDRRHLVLHLVGLAVSLVGICAGTKYDHAAPEVQQGDNGHTAKKSPMDYSRYAQDAREISGHNSGLHGSLALNTCDSKYQLKNSTIIRTKDSINIGADFVSDTTVGGATECRWKCCQKEGNCDTAIFVEDKTKDNNCFLFKCWDEGILKCQFSSHWGYVTAIIGGFDDAPPTSQVASADDSGSDDVFNHNGEDVQSENVDSTDKLEEDSSDPTQCLRGEIQCANGECIIAHHVCDGREDCTDGSDEMGCKYDTNTPSSHSSHSSYATNLPQIDPTAAKNLKKEEKLQLPDMLDLEEVRSELASQLHRQSMQEKIDSGDQTVDKGLKGGQGEGKGNAQGDVSQGDAKSDPQDGKYDSDGGSQLTSSKAKPDAVPADTQESQEDLGVNREVSGERLSKGLRPLQPSGLKDQDGFNQASADQRKLGEIPDNNPAEKQGQMSGQMKQLDDPDKPLQSRPANPHRNGLKQDQVPKTSYRPGNDNQPGGYGGDSSKTPDQPQRGLGNRDRPIPLGHTAKKPGYNPQRNPNPSGPNMGNDPNMGNGPGFSDRFNPNPDRNDDGKDNLYSYDIYNKPYGNPPDYNYPNDMFKEMTNPDQNYQDGLYDDTPLYTDLQETGYNPDQINYHQRDRFNSKYDNQGSRESLPRPHSFDKAQDGWRQRGGGGESGMRNGGGTRGGIPRVNGRPYQDKPGPGDGTSRDGSWNHWNEYNHRGDDTYLPGIQDGYNGNDRGDDTVGYNPDDAKGGGDGHKDTGGDSKSGGFGDYGGNSNEDTDSGPGGGQEEKEVPVATESKGPVDSPTTPSVSAVQPHQPTVPASAIYHQDEDQSQPDLTPKTDGDNAQPDHGKEHEVEPFGSHPATSAILPLAVGLIITLLVLMMLSCRLRYMNQRLRYGRLKTHAHDADYLINGMYL